MKRGTVAQRLRIAALLIAAGAVLGLIALGWLVVVYPSERPAGRGRTVAVSIAETSTLADVAASLAAEGLVSRPRVFALYARVLGANDRLRRGRVLVTDDMNMRELLQRVATGFGSTELRITIPEGWNRFEIADRLAAWGVCEREAFVRATEGVEHEGFLFPDTYRLRDGAPAEQVVQRMHDNGRSRLSRLIDEEAAAFAELRSSLGIDLHGLVTLASIVEEEAHAPSEQAIIAGVFWNRLRDPAFKPKRLQADPTVAYGCLVAPELASCQGFDGRGRNITRTMTADPANPYNTYRHDGLPPGPICNPGLSALRAVLHPAQHAYFYFVARGDGHHDFSTTLAQHVDAVQGHRPAPAAPPR